MSVSDESQSQVNRYKRSHNVVASTLDGLVCLFNLETCDYFSLNDTGSAIWSCIEKPATVPEIASHITKIYEINDDECCREIEAWLETAKAHGAIDVIS